MRCCCRQRITVRLARFSTSLAFEALWFPNGATCRKCKRKTHIALTEYPRCRRPTFWIPRQASVNLCGKDSCKRWDSLWRVHCLSSVFFLGILCVFVYFCLSFCVVNVHCKLRWIKIIIIIVPLDSFRLGYGPVTLLYYYLLREYSQFLDTVPAGTSPRHAPDGGLADILSAEIRLDRP